MTAELVIPTVSRNKWNEVFLRHLASYVSSPTLAPGSPSRRESTAVEVTPNTAAKQLYDFIAKPRARCCDFGMRDPASGTTVLHEAVRRRDLALIKLVLSRGADVLARDKRGKLPIDVAKDEKVKDILKSAANSEGRALARATSSVGGAERSTAGGNAKMAGLAPMSTATSAGAGSVSSAASSVVGVTPVATGKQPVMKGYLQKWTNLARGYKPRWFVLDNGASARCGASKAQLTRPPPGVLSYYRDQSDEGNVSRGSISMGVAKVDPPGTDKLKFTVGSKIDRTAAVYLKGAREWD